MKTLTPEQLELIKKPLPKDSVSKHPTRQGMSSIKAIYVTERLNEVFGVGAWQIKIEPVIVTDKGQSYMVKTYTTSNQKERTEFFAVTKTIFDVPDYGIHYECVAGAANDDLGDSYKGSTTDALTKIASWIGIGMDVFKGQQEQATREYERQVTSTFNARLQEALDALVDCYTIDELKKLKSKVADDVKANQSFIQAARKRFGEIGTKAPEETVNQ